MSTRAPYTAFIQRARHETTHSIILCGTRDWRGTYKQRPTSMCKNAGVSLPSAKKLHGKTMASLCACFPVKARATSTTGTHPICCEH